MFWWYEVVEAIEATELIEAVEVIEAAEVPDGRENYPIIKVQATFDFLRPFEVISESSG